MPVPEQESREALHAAKAKEAYELKKVQQRTAAIIVFAVVYPCVFALIGVAKGIEQEGRAGEAYVLVFIACAIALLQTCGILAILGRRVCSPLWIPLAIVPPIAAAIWYI